MRFSILPSAPNRWNCSRPGPSLTDRDINIFQEAILTSIPFVDLHQAQLEVVVLLYGIMTPGQRHSLQTARWYIDGMENLMHDLATAITRNDSGDPVMARLNQIFGISE